MMRSATSHATLTWRSRQASHRWQADHTSPPCQFCGAPLEVTWADLGEQPLANAYCTDETSARRTPSYPLHARFCGCCLLVQVDRVVPPDAIFSDYPYLSSNSASWLQHCERYAEAMIARFGLTPHSRVIEIGSNDGHLLRMFAAAGMQVLGIDPAQNLGEMAQHSGVPTEIAFFGSTTASSLVARGFAADHLSAKNVLAHVPDIADFARGVAILLKRDAVFTVEFPHLLRTMEGMQFDQIYHEHFSYLSLLVAQRVLGSAGLRIFDVEPIETHGGSLRVFACHDGARHPTAPSIERMIEQEIQAGLADASGYRGFERRMKKIRSDFLDFVTEQRAAGKSVVGYGAAAKANTFLNFCAADPQTLAFIADRSDEKAGKYMPRSAIPIAGVAAITAARPDFVVILPWNWREEIVSQLAFISEWGGRFVTAIPSLQIF